MSSLKDYIKESLSPLKLSKEDKEKLLRLDKEYGKCFDMFRHDRNDKDVLNLEEECKKFLEARKTGTKYFPYIELNPHKFKTDGLLRRVQNLIAEFYKFNSPVSKYYLEILEPMEKKIKFVLNPERYLQWYINYQAQKPSLDMYQKAMRTLKENPYQVVDKDDRTINGKEAAKMIQKHIDDLGYKWKVKLNSNMIPRMNVDTDCTMNVNPEAMFSATDIEGLKRHEVEGHIGRRYYGLKTGLNLFLYGLLWRNILDEGLAVWNSLNKVDKVKPNVLFNISLKTIICYHLGEMDFCELFDYCKELAPNMPDESLFATLVRFKRELQDCSINGGNGDDQSYFCGLQIIDKMSDAERDDILKYNIGPSHICELPEIKEFLRINEFSPLI